MKKEGPLLVVQQMASSFGGPRVLISINKKVKLDAIKESRLPQCIYLQISVSAYFFHSTFCSVSWTCPQS